MKAKNINKKLFLNKKTVADLNGSQMEHLKGGIDKPPEPCRDTYANSGCHTGLTCATVCSCPSACSLGGNCC
jgi:hypothetical protein